MSRHIRTVRQAAFTMTTVAGLSALAGLAAPAAHADNGPAYNLSKSIVWVDVTSDLAVEVPFTGGQHKTFTTTVGIECTGFFISTTGDVATAGHCVELNEDLRIAAIQKVINDQELIGGDNRPLDATRLSWPVRMVSQRASVGQPDGIDGGPLSGKHMVTAQIAQSQPFDKGDHALLHIANMSATPALKLAANPPTLGDSIVSIGFPGSVAGNADVIRQPPSFKPGTVSSPTVTGSGAPNIEVSSPMTQGMSGGPTVNLRGEVLGLNSYKLRGETQAFNFITDTDTMRRFFTTQGVTLSTTPAADNGSGSNSGSGNDSGSGNGSGTAPGNGSGNGSGNGNDGKAPAPGSGRDSAVVSQPVSSESDRGLLFGGVALALALGLGGVGVAVARSRRASASAPHLPFPPAPQQWVGHQAPTQAAGDAPWQTWSPQHPQSPTAHAAHSTAAGQHVQEAPFVDPRFTQQPPVPGQPVLEQPFVEQRRAS
jgi:hypothetical protein